METEAACPARSAVGKGDEVAHPRLIDTGTRFLYHAGSFVPEEEREFVAELAVRVVDVTVADAARSKSYEDFPRTGGVQEDLSHLRRLVDCNRDDTFGGNLHREASHWPDDRAGS